MTNANNTSKIARVGLVVSLAMLTLMGFLFFIGSQQKLFSSKREFRVRLSNVTGLAEGNPVQLSGVRIGSVSSIELPVDPRIRTVAITIAVDRKFAPRIRQDSQARVKKLGLIAADSYIDVTPGSPNLPALPQGAVIPSKSGANVDKLMESGEDLVTNLVHISHSLRNVLVRVDRGEGLIGELTMNTGKTRVTDTFHSTLQRTNDILAHVQSGRGLAGRLLYDDVYARQLTGSIDSTVRSLQSISTNVQTSLQSGKGMLPALLNDPTGREKVNRIVENLEVASKNVAELSNEIRTGDGLLPRLINDEKVGKGTLDDFQLMVHRLADTARQLNEGEGSVGKLISDPTLYNRLDEILQRINTSRLMRWIGGGKAKPAPKANKPDESSKKGKSNATSAPEVQNDPPADDDPPPELEPPAPESGQENGTVTAPNEPPVPPPSAVGGVS